MCLVIAREMVEEIGSAHIGGRANETMQTLIVGRDATGVSAFA
jgi:hypothetical protein